MSNTPTLTLYTRVGCHLCTDMEQQLALLQLQHDFALKVVDIDTDTELKLRYSEQVPVLAVGQQEICHYHLNQELLLKYLASLKA